MSTIEKVKRSDYPEMHDRTPVSHGVLPDGVRVIKRCSVCNDEYLILPSAAKNYNTCSSKCSSDRKKQPQGMRAADRPASAIRRSSVHSWLAYHYPRTGVCSECGGEGKIQYAFLHHPSLHTRKIEDYLELCSQCHFRMDRVRGQPWWKEMQQRTHLTRRMLQSLDAYWLHCDGLPNNRYPRSRSTAEDWWGRFERYRAELEKTIQW